MSSVFPLYALIAACLYPNTSIQHLPLLVSGTLLCEHFIYGMFPGYGYRYIRSPQVEQCLESDDLDWLKNLGHNLTSERTVESWFPDNAVYSITFLKPVVDNYGRHASWNHTILLHAKDYIKYTQPLQKCKPLFITELAEPVPMLEPLQIGETPI